MSSIDTYSVIEDFKRYLEADPTPTFLRFFETFSDSLFDELQDICHSQESFNLTEGLARCWDKSVGKEGMDQRISTFREIVGSLTVSSMRRKGYLLVKFDDDGEDFIKITDLGKEMYQDLYEPVIVFNEFERRLLDESGYTMITKSRYSKIVLCDDLGKVKVVVKPNKDMEIDVNISFESGEDVRTFKTVNKALYYVDLFYPAGVQ